MVWKSESRWKIAEKEQITQIQVEININFSTMNYDYQIAWHERIHTQPWMSIKYEQTRGFIDCFTAAFPLYYELIMNGETLREIRHFSLILQSIYVFFCSITQSDSVYTTIIIFFFSLSPSLSSTNKTNQVDVYMNIDREWINKVQVNGQWKEVQVERCRNINLNQIFNVWTFRNVWRSNCT